MSKTDTEKQLIENLSIISHELQTPVSLISATAKLTDMMLDKDKFNCDEFKGYVSNIINNCNKLSMLISNISEVNHISNSHKEYVDLKEFFKTFYETVIPFGVENDTSIKCEITSQKEYIYASPVMLERLLLNLITNAIKYNDKTKKTIKIKVYDDDDNNLIISVKDNGIGIEKENIPRVTEEFFRVDKTTAPGVGIGLSIAKKYIDSINGKLKIKSRIKKGTEIIISIPDLCEDVFTAKESAYVYVPEKASFNIEFAQLKKPYMAD
ncbi:MAG: HAMP domain-containing sensor histidine kinase [Clostridia bacterium]|nr:HAMP domain-containing sensor histidine kinase [Clostridia bacterium]